jgi:hypothetical protein
VGITNVREVPVLVQLVAVAEFEVSEDFLEITFQGIEEQALIFGETVCPAVIAAVTVAEEDEPGLVIEGDFLGRLEDFGETGGYSYSLPPLHEKRTR